MTSIILNIGHLLWSLIVNNFQIPFLWVLGHAGIRGNELADSLSNSISNFLFSGSYVHQYTDFIFLLWSTISSYWNANWVNLPRSNTNKYKTLSSTTSLNPWFQNLHISRNTIARYCGHCIGHNCLLTHAFKLGFKDCASCMFPDCGDKKCDTYHLLLNCSFLNTQRLQLSNLCSSPHITFFDINLLSYFHY